MRRLKVLLADDHQLMLEAVQTVLDGEEDIVVVGATSNGTEVLPLVGQTDPDLLLLDLRMPEMDGLTIMDRLRERHPRVKTVVLSALDDSDVVEAAFLRGAVAFVSKTIDPRDLASALRQATDGTVHHPYGMPTDRTSSPVDVAGLSESQLRVLNALAQGFSNKEIAKELWLSEQTVKFHLSNIYRRFGVSSRTEAIRYAYQHRLISSPVWAVA